MEGDYHFSGLFETGIYKALVLMGFSKYHNNRRNENADKIYI
jgi:hypothetical protein